MSEESNTITTLLTPSTTITTINAAKYETNTKKIDNNDNKNMCVFCSKIINDQYIYKVSDDMKWHEKCLKCNQCGTYLEENSTCYIKDSKVYCKNGCLRLKNSTKCSRCAEFIKFNELIIKFKTSIYHISCFYCDLCNKKLSAGDEFQINDNNLIICRDDTIINNTEYSINTVNKLTKYKSKSSLNNIDNDNIEDITICNATNENNSISPLLLQELTFVHNDNSNNSNNNINYILMKSIDDYNNQQQLLKSYKNYNNSIIDYNGNETKRDNNNKLDYNNYKSFNLDEEDSDSLSDKDISIKLTRNCKKPKQTSSSSSSSSSSIFNQHTKPARIRTVLNEKQLHTLRACYNANPRPDALMKEQLVEMTGLSPRVIRVWFQNKRCKDKKKTLMVRNGIHHSVVFENCL